MKKSRLILALIGTVFCSALLIIVVYAWYVNMYTSSDMKFEILQIQSLVSLYKANDSNYNGIPDKLATENIGKYINNSIDDGHGHGSYLTYAAKYYDETFEFEYLDQRYALSKDSSSNLLNTIVIDDCVPSKVYTYKFEITNLSQMENNIEFAFIEEENVIIDETKLSEFEVRMGTVGSNGKASFTSWRGFLTNDSYSAFTISPANLTIPAVTTGLSVGRLDVWLEIRQKSASTTTMTSFTLPQFKMTLSIESGESQNP